MGSVSRIFSIHGSQFDAGVVHAGDPAPAESVKREIPDAIQTALSELLFKVAGKEKEICKALVGERVDLNARCRAFIEGYSARAHESLVEEHENLKKECIAQQDRISALKTKIVELEQEALRKSNAATLATIALTDAEQARKTLGRFASAGEIKKSDAAIEAARRKFEEASSNAAPVREEINRLIFTELPRLGEELRRLSAAELRLRSTLTGQAFTDEELGIQVPARPPAA